MGTKSTAEYSIVNNGQQLQRGFNSRVNRFQLTAIRQSPKSSAGSKFTPSTVQYNLHEKLSRISLLPCCDSTQIYIPWIQTYINYFNAHMLYLLYRCLKTLSVGMAHSVYLLGCGLRNRACVDRFQEILRIFSSPKYPDCLWARTASLKLVTNTVSPYAKRQQLEANHSPPSST